MNARELSELIAPHAANGRGARIPVLVQCGGRIHPVSTVEVRVQGDPAKRPRDVAVLIIADAT